MSGKSAELHGMSRPGRLSGLANATAIFGREFRAFFLSPVAYVIIIIFLIPQNWFFLAVMNLLSDMPEAGVESPMSLMFGSNVFVWLLLFATMPAITMKLFAEEKKTGTFEMLMTAPVMEMQIVAGKYAAALAMYAMMWLPTIAYVIVLSVLGDPDLLKIAAGYTGVLLVGAMFLGFGTLASAVTRSQIIAYFLGMFMCLGVLLLSVFAENIPGVRNITGIRGVFEYVNVIGHVGAGFSRGIVDTRNVLYYMSLLLLSLFAAVHALESRRWKRWAALSALGTMILATCLAGVINVISYRDYRRMDWTSARFYELSEVTDELLSGLEKDLQITVFMRPQILEYGQEMPNPIYGYTRELLERFRNINPVRIEIDWYDPDWEGDRVEELLKKYGVVKYETENTLGVVVMEYGAGFHRYITSRDLASFEVIQDPIEQMSSMPRLKAFTGEAALVAALKDLMMERKTKLYFLAGHGEKDINDTDSRKGLPGLRETLDRENITVEKLENIAVRGVPQDCDVLIVAGPRRSVSAADVAIISDYFKAGGNLILLLDPLADRQGSRFIPTGFESITAGWGIRLHQDIVTGWIMLGAPTRVNPVPAVAEDCTHRVIDELRDAGIAFAFDAPCSMILTETPGKVLHAEALVKTPKGLWGETDLQSYKKGTNTESDSDRHGPLVVAAAVHEKNAAGGTVGRAVVFGDSDFVTDRMLTGGNADLFMNSIYWLSRSPIQKGMIGIAPKEPSRVRISITRDRLGLVVWPVVLGLPGAVLLFGLVVWWRRRRG